MDFDDLFSRIPLSRFRAFSPFRFGESFASCLYVSVGMIWKDGTSSSLGHCGTPQAPWIIAAPNHNDLTTIEPSMFGHVIVAGGLMSLQPVNNHEMKSDLWLICFASASV